MKTIIENPTANHNSKTIAGIIILAIGGVILINNLNPDFIPNWLFSWPMLLIGWGVYLGSKHNFKNSSWLVMILFGAAFLFTENVPHIDAIVWPIVIIAWGLWMIFRFTYNTESRQL